MQNVTVKYLKSCYEISGDNQSHTEMTGALGVITTVGNLWRSRLNSDKKAGTWKINIQSTQPYTVKVTGQTGLIIIIGLNSVNKLCA